MHPNFLHCKTIGWDCEHLLNQMLSINSKTVKAVYFDAMLCIRKNLQFMFQFKKKKIPRSSSSWTSTYGMDISMLKIKRNYYNSRKRTCLPIQSWNLFGCKEKSYRVLRHSLGYWNIRGLKEIDFWKIVYLKREFV